MPDHLVREELFHASENHFCYIADYIPALVWAGNADGSRASANVFASLVAQWKFNRARIVCPLISRNLTLPVARRSNTIPLLSPDSGLAKPTKGFLPEKKVASYASFTRAN
jgi:hypothetical protein